VAFHAYSPRYQAEGERVLVRPQPIMSLGAVLLTASALAVAGCDTSTGTAAKQGAYTITEPVTSLKINNPVGNTQIEGTDATTVSVTEKLSYTGNPPQTSHSLTDGQLNLSYTCPSGVGDTNVNACGVTYVVTVPRRIAVQVDGKVGATTLTGLAGQLTLTSSTGSIDATGLTSGAVTARTSAGTITLGFTAPPTTVNAQAQVGSLTVQLPAGTAYAVDAGSQVGSVDVTVQRDSGSAHRVTAHSQVGAVTVNNG
jgi:Putative adhesin